MKITNKNYFYSIIKREFNIFDEESECREVWNTLSRFDDNDYIGQIVQYENEPDEEYQSEYPHTFIGVDDSDFPFELKVRILKGCFSETYDFIKDLAEILKLKCKKVRCFYNENTTTLLINLSGYQNDIHTHVETEERVTCLMPYVINPVTNREEYIAYAKMPLGYVDEDTQNQYITHNVFLNKHISPMEFWAMVLHGVNDDDDNTKGKLNSMLGQCYINSNLHFNEKTPF